MQPRFLSKIVQKIINFILDKNICFMLNLKRFHRFPLILGLNRKCTNNLKETQIEAKVLYSSALIIIPSPHDAHYVAAML